ncbi:MAG: GTPase HflX [Spirochaetia bacterium]|nr:GTPase HflX [Spirochaetia bacterium]
MNKTKISETMAEMEKAWLVGIQFQGNTISSPGNGSFINNSSNSYREGYSRISGKDNVSLHLNELEALLDTLEVKAAGRTIAPLKKPSAALLLGRGKTEEIIAQAKEAESDLIVFDEDLSPTQQRNWERASGLKVIDRQEVIINIFADRARTKEASLQVELASCKYHLPRLAGAWQHLSRQRGGSYGTKGEGEKQIELDKRLLLKKIAKLKEELEEVKKQRGTMRKLRTGKKLFTCAIAGYTNSGKSTLLNSLTGSDLNANNRLFDTLDPATRNLRLTGGREIIITDTVGFIRKLPHQLVEAFQSTLEETLIADLIILLLDASGSEVKNHYEASMDVLREIGADKNKRLIVFNKIDLCDDDLSLSMLKKDFPGSVFISAGKGENLIQLEKEIEKAASENDSEIYLLIPPSRYELIQLIRKTGILVSEEYTEKGALIEAIVPGYILPQLDQYSIEKPE